MILFAHRGFLGGFLENSNLKPNTIKAFQNAIDNNFKAIELDIWYVEGDFFLNHNKPRNNLSKYDKLSDLFLKLGNKTKYWLDFKNLDIKNVKNACEKLKKIADHHQIDYENLIFIPCLDKVNLDINLPIYQQIRDIFGQNCQIGTFLSKIDKKNLLKYYQKLKANNIKILSIKFTNIDQDFAQIFHDIDLYSWTINDQKDLNYLEKLNVKAVATDSIKPE